VAPVEQRPIYRPPDERQEERRASGRNRQLLRSRAAPLWGPARRDGVAEKKRQRPRGERSMRIFAMLAAAALSVASATACLAQPPDAALKIAAVTDFAGKADPQIGLESRLVVRLGGTAVLDPTGYALFIDGRRIDGLGDTRLEVGGHALIFVLRRNDTNAEAWKALLGSPTRLTRPAMVALGAIPAQCAVPQCLPAIPTITGDGNNDRIELGLPSPWRVAFAILFVVVLVAALWILARRTTLLKDNLLPQIAPAQQPYSLGRWQMAFWFTLIFATFIALYVLMVDYHTISPQALALMGVSGLTGISSIAVDIIKDTPADAANRALRALGFNQHDDVERTRQEIVDRQRQIAPGLPPLQLQTLNDEIRDRQSRLQTYQERIAPFVTAGWYRDLTTDLNGGALHRVQIVAWTLVLGVVFVIGVYIDLAMPQFDTTLLALMGLSSAGYVGFKYPEAQQ
jgi:hypothetical protein